MFENQLINQSEHLINYSNKQFKQSYKKTNQPFNQKKAIKQTDKDKNKQTIQLIKLFNK